MRGVVIPAAGRRPRAWAAGGVAGIVLSLVVVGAVRGHGDDNFEVGSTGDGGGQLAAARIGSEPVVPSFSASIAGFSIYTADLPAFDAAAVDEPARPLFVLNDGTQVRLQVAAPTDAGASIKVNGVALAAVGASAVLGTFAAANPSAFHGDVVWTLTVPNDTTGDFRLSFTLTTTAGYGTSAVVTTVLRIPSATPTPTATPTGAATATPGGSAATVTPTPAPTTSAAPHLADLAAAKAAAKCRAAFVKEADRLARAWQKSLGGCASALYRCAQTKPDDASCAARAAAACAKSRAKAEAADAALGSRLVPACGALAPSAVLAVAGLGYDLAADACAADAGVAVGDLASAAACVARRQRCAVERSVVTRHPRLVELLDHAGCAAPPDARLDAFGGTGEGAGDPKGTGKVLARCDGAVRKAADKLLGRRAQAHATCTGAVFACVQTKPGDAVCVGKAAAACDKALGKLAAADAAFDGTLAKGCSAVPFDVLAAATGARLAVLAPACAVLDVPALATLDDYARCLRRRLVCASETMLHLHTPRADELLALVGRPSASAFCGP